MRWVNHVNGWIARDGITVVKYENIIINCSEVVELIGNVLYMDRPEKIRVPTLNDLSVAPRKGIIGDWRNSFTDDDLLRFNKIAKKMMSRLGYK